MRYSDRVPFTLPTFFQGDGVGEFHQEKHCVKIIKA